MTDTAARMAVLPTLPDLDPNGADDDQRAMARADVIADGHPALSMMDWQVRHVAASTLAIDVFPTTTAANATKAVRAWLDMSTLTILSEDVRDDVAAAFAQAWYPQSHAL